MAEDIAGNLQTYQLQLQQVASALDTDPENEELIKLRKDLAEVIELTKELLKSQTANASNKEGAPGGSQPAVREFKIGDKCLALWPEDKQFYEATIVEIGLLDDHCTVSFLAFEHRQVTQMSTLKPMAKKKPITVEMVLGEDKLKSKKQIVKIQREYKKKKQQKKAQRIQKLEEEREEEKTKWQSFNSKAFNKNKKGQVKKSIFASPENPGGRVGVGTCGIGGKPMTEYHQQEKWRRNMSS